MALLATFLVDKVTRTAIGARAHIKSFSSVGGAVRCLELSGSLGRRWHRERKILLNAFLLQHVALDGLSDRIGN